MSGVMIHRAGQPAPAEPAAPAAPEADPVHALMFMVQHLHATIQAIAEAMQHMAAQMEQTQTEIADLQSKIGAPKQILRDHTGRAVGIRPTL